MKDLRTVLEENGIIIAENKKFELAATGTCDYEYDNNGHCIYEHSYTDGMGDEEISREYNDKGQLVKSDDGTFCQTYEYDENDNLVRSIGDDEVVTTVETFEDGSRKVDILYSRENVFKVQIYDGYGSLIEEDIYEGQDRNGELITETFYDIEYDEDGNILSSVYENERDHRVIKSEYIYNDKKQCTQVNTDNGSTMYLFYDEDGMLQRTIYSMASGLYNDIIYINENGLRMHKDVLTYRLCDDEE